jgi:hypothetical protein
MRPHGPQWRQRPKTARHGRGAARAAARHAYSAAVTSSARGVAGYALGVAVSSENNRRRSELSGQRVRRLCGRRRGARAARLDGDSRRCDDPSSGKGDGDLTGAAPRKETAAREWLTERGGLRGEREECEAEAVRVAAAGRKATARWPYRRGGGGTRPVGDGGVAHSNTRGRERTAGCGFGQWRGADSGPVGDAFKARPHTW